MANSGVAYITSKEGILRAVIIVFAIVTFALIASVCGNCSDVVGWILAAFIIAFCFSLLSYFFIATTLASKMNCGISYEVGVIPYTVPLVYYSGRTFSKVCFIKIKGFQCCRLRGGVTWNPFRQRILINV